MAQTTTQIAACNARLEVDNEAGTPTDVSGSTNNASLDMSRDVGEATTFDGDYKLRSECKRDASLSIRALWTTSVSEARELLEAWFDLGGKRTVTIYPNGTAVGNRYYTGEFRLTGFNIGIDAGSADPIPLEIEAVADGPVAFLNVGS